MRRQTIDKIIKLADSDKTAIEMILSSCVDYGSEDGALLSVKKFSEAAEMIINYFKEKSNDDYEKDECFGFKTGEDEARVKFFNWIIKKISENAKNAYMEGYETGFHAEMSDYSNDGGHVAWEKSDIKKDIE